MVDFQHQMVTSFLSHWWQKHIFIYPLRKSILQFRLKLKCFLFYFILFLIPQIGSHIPIHLLIKSKGVCQHYNVYVVFIEAFLIISKLVCNQDILQEMRRKKKNPGISTQWDFCFQKKKSIMPQKRHRNPKAYY